MPQKFFFLIFDLKMVSCGAFCVVKCDLHVELQESEEETRYRPGKSKGVGAPTLATRPHFKPSLTVIQSLWNGMVPLLAGMIKSLFSIMVLILVKQKLLLPTLVI